LTLLTRNLQDVLGENDPRVGARLDELWTEDGVFCPRPGVSTVAATD
jgi:hypothetical protein